MVFKMNIYSRRWGHEDTHHVEMTEEGWKISHLKEHLDEAICDKTGKPHFFKRMDQDLINYPEELGNYMEYLWDQASETNLTEKEIQEHLNELATWINAVEKASPKGEFWNHYK